MSILRSIALLSLLPAAAPAAEALATRGQATYEKKIKPMLEQYCFDCHADGMDKGNFTFDKYTEYSALRSDMKFWDHVRQQIVTHVMPPEKKDKPSLVQRDEMVAWIDDAIFWFDPTKPDPGHVTYRRLNRTEYNNTVKDLLYVDSRPAREFPPDDTGYGYDNIGDVLSLSPMLMEKYLRASRAVADIAMDAATPGHADVEIVGRKFYKQKGETKEDGTRRWFFTNAEVSQRFGVPADGTYTVTLHVAATQVGGEHAKLGLKVNGKEESTFEVTQLWKADKPEFQAITQTLSLKAGETKLTVAFLNDQGDEKNPKASKKDRNVVLDKVELKGPHSLLAPRGSRFLRWLLNEKPVGLPAVQWTGEDLESGQGVAQKDTGGIRLSSKGYVKHPVQINSAGKYRITVKAGAQQAGEDPAKFDVRIAGNTVGAFSVTAKNQTPQTFNLDAQIPAGSHEIQIWFLNDYYEAATKADRNLWVHQVKIEGPLDKGGAIQAAAVPALVEKMGTRLFRRPMTSDEKTKWQEFATLAMKEGEKPLGALRFVLEGMLVSPSFLFRGDPQPVGAITDGSALIDEYSLASRLSYFFWSSPPDSKLLELASKGQLRQNLAAEMKRMIGDARAWSLTEDFAGQWLQIRDMDIVTPDVRRFPEWKGGVGFSMKKESQLFFDHIFRENRSIIDFLNADYTFADKKLADWYGLKDFKGDKFQKVSLVGTPRGGILTQGSVLTLTSGQTRTSPVKRGKYLLENILGTPPPPAPGGVPPLDEAKVRKSKMTLRDQFAEHRANTSCAGCHAFLDPMGFAFEHYDAIGRYREKEKDLPIDAAGTLVRGQAFQDMTQLREILARDMADDFTRNLAENMLTFALGRGLEHSDKPAIKEIVRRTKEDGYKFQSLTLAVIESVPFQKMRVGGEAE
ncbi:putative xylan-binding protein with Ca-dependent carbohydrate-binding module [Prosthecobacter fusiformis]|uniref:Putative xylan-binding protein with Ca-dependent carbohydrate-binding module n=1 Tax=Prosthecobacter fusiformis TaxID=48464 RepID=A0A4R7S5N3_9BACT|nr:DUF1592 domain-containing protein [Prosthecobacter fusiformis]TDU73189.1 putative xylan-binding protein with Ca-dependent carbohydrate-binding module [Prosthecobacter fusiformis]